jgi:hypothetical protein
VNLAMMTPTVSEIARRFEAVTRDPFIDGSSFDAAAGSDDGLRAQRRTQATTAHTVHAALAAVTAVLLLATLVPSALASVVVTPTGRAPVRADGPASRPAPTTGKAADDNSALPSARPQTELQRRRQLGIDQSADAGPAVAVLLITGGALLVTGAGLLSIRHARRRRRSPRTTYAPIAPQRVRY